MHPKELLNKTLVAASVAESSGFEATAAALREVAAAMFAELNSKDQNATPAELKQKSNTKLALVC
jgi:hypothetical protein